MTVRISISDDTYQSAAKHSGYKDAGPWISGLVAGYCAWLDGYRGSTPSISQEVIRQEIAQMFPKPAAFVPNCAPIEPSDENRSTDSTVDYSLQWAQLKLPYDPDDKMLNDAKKFLIARKGEKGALEWLQEKKANGIRNLRSFLIGWYRDNKDA